MKKLLSILATMMLILTFASCSDKQDGDWDPMKWKLNGKKVKECIATFDAAGGEAIFECTNYTGMYFPKQQENDSFTHIDGTWYTAEIVGNKITVKVEAATNPDDLPREAGIYVSVGDTGSGIRLIQE